MTVHTIYTAPNEINAYPAGTYTYQYHCYNCGHGCISDSSLLSCPNCGAGTPIFQQTISPNVLLLVNVTDELKNEMTATFEGLKQSPGNALKAIIQIVIMSPDGDINAQITPELQMEIQEAGQYITVSPGPELTLLINTIMAIKF